MGRQFEKEPYRKGEKIYCDKFSTMKIGEDEICYIDLEHDVFLRLLAYQAACLEPKCRFSRDEMTPEQVKEDYFYILNLIATYEEKELRTTSFRDIHHSCFVDYCGDGEDE